MGKQKIIEVVGVEITAKMMSSYNKELRDEYKKLIAKTSKTVVKTARPMAPVYRGVYVGKQAKTRTPGDTRKSIKVKKYNNGMDAWVKPRRPQGWRAHFHEHGTVRGVRALKFMTRAGNKVKPVFEAEAKQIIDREVVI